MSGTDASTEYRHREEGGKALRIFVLRSGNEPCHQVEKAIVKFQDKIGCASGLRLKVADRTPGRHDHVAKYQTAFGQQQLCLVLQSRLAMSRDGIGLTASDDAGYCLGEILPGMPKSVIAGSSCKPLAALR